jgi:hypothetical protein
MGDLGEGLNMNDRTLLDQLTIQVGRLHDRSHGNLRTHLYRAHLSLEDAQAAMSAETKEKVPQERA